MQLATLNDSVEMLHESYVTATLMDELNVGWNFQTVKNGKKKQLV